MKTPSKTSFPSKNKRLILSASGSSLHDLFVDSTRQLLSLLMDPLEISETIREKIVLDVPNCSLLLRDWINTLLGLTDHQGIIFLQARFLHLHVGEEEASLKAEVIGELVDPNRHTFRQSPRRLRCLNAVVTQKAGQCTAIITMSVQNHS
jgi:SHS2 domain-containing protein